MYAYIFVVIAMICGVMNPMVFLKITVGCIKQQDGVKVGFTIGEYSETNKSITIEAFSWENDRWGGI